MLGDSDELDLTDPGCDPSVDTGEWLAANQEPLPKFVEVPSAPWLRRLPDSPPALTPDPPLYGSERERGGGFTLFLAFLYLLLAASVGFAVVAVGMMLFARTG